MPSDDSILVLTTREKNWWWSMQEIIPAIERVWTRIGQDKQENVRVLIAPLSSEVEQSLQNSASHLKRIVITAATPEIVRIALLLRVQMRAAAPMIIYVSGDSTEGFHAFGALSNALTERDMFVVFCNAEADATRCCFPNAEVSVIPIPLVDEFKVNGWERDTRLTAAKLAYVGRVSEQKNLHTLLFSLWILRTLYGQVPRISLELYGGEDNLGSPNMGSQYSNYGRYLQGLTELLGLDHMVTWHGFKSRNWLFDNVHLKPHILVSPTLHSDENFGSSVLASLVNGHQVVTTAWGGHLGFQLWFPGQLILVPVHRSTIGPVVDPFLLANAILRAANRMGTVVVEDATLERARAEFSERNITTRTFEMLSRPAGKLVALEKSATQRYLDEQRALFGGARKIYANYEDPVAQMFFEIYGMRGPLTFQEKSSYILAPWTRSSNYTLRVNDPHRGHQSFRVYTPISEPVDVTLCPSMNICRLPGSLVKTLVMQGYAFLLRQ